MRLVLLVLSALALCSAPLAGAGAPGPFSVVPFNQVQWSDETPGQPSTAGLAGRWQLIIVVDWEEAEGKTGRTTYKDFANKLYKDQTSEQRFIPIAIGVNGTLDRRGDTEPNVILKGGSQPGLLRALAGDANGALVLVAPDGRVQRIQRQSGDINPIRSKLEKDLSSATPLLSAPASFPATCKAALELLRLGDVGGAVGVARKRLGPDGALLIKSLQEQANVLIEADTARVSAATSTAGERFIARERLKGLLEEFPGLPAAAAATAALKAKPSADLLAEAKAWAALQDYLAQMGKLSAKKSVAVQQQMIPGIIAAFPGTYAAELATMIKAAARLP